MCNVCDGLVLIVCVCACSVIILSRLKEKGNRKRKKHKQRYYSNFVRLALSVVTQLHHFSNRTASQQLLPPLKALVFSAMSVILNSLQETNSFNTSKIPAMHCMSINQANHLLPVITNSCQATGKPREERETKLNSNSNYIVLRFSYLIDHAMYYVDRICIYINKFCLFVCGKLYNYFVCENNCEMILLLLCIICASIGCHSYRQCHQE